MNGGGASVCSLRRVRAWLAGDAMEWTVEYTAVSFWTILWLHAALRRAMEGAADGQGGAMFEEGARVEDSEDATRTGAVADPRKRR